MYLNNYKFDSRRHMLVPVKFEGKTNFAAEILIQDMCICIKFEDLPSKAINDYFYMTPNGFDFTSNFSKKFLQYIIT